MIFILSSCSVSYLSRVEKRHHRIGFNIETVQLKINFKQAVSITVNSTGDLLDGDEIEKIPIRTVANVEIDKNEKLYSEGNSMPAIIQLKPQNFLSKVLADKKTDLSNIKEKIKQGNFFSKSSNTANYKPMFEKSGDDSKKTGKRYIVVGSIFIAIGIIVTALGTVFPVFFGVGGLWVLFGCMYFHAGLIVSGLSQG